MTQPKKGKLNIVSGTFILVLTVCCLIWQSAGQGALFAAPSDWAAAEVSKAIELGFVAADLQNNYQSPITRAQFCRLAVALYEKTIGEIDGTLLFEDTDDVYIGKAAYLNIVSGVGENIFDPEGRLTREQAAAILTRLLKAMNKPSPAVSPEFGDNKQISGWAFKDVGTMQITGIMRGNGNNFDPKGSYSIEQSIATLLRMNGFTEIKETANLSDYYSIFSAEYAGIPLNILKVRYSSGRFHPVTLQANNALVSAQPLKEMAAEAGVSIAVNGTYFDAYSDTPTPSGTIIKNGKILYLSNNASTIAFTKDGEVFIDRLKYTLRIRVNHQDSGSLYPWTINNQHTHETAVLLFTEEYPNKVEISNGAKAFLFDREGVIKNILDNGTDVPKDHSILLLNSAAVNTYETWSKIDIGDVLTLEAKFTPHGNPDMPLDNIWTAISAGPLLLKNGDIVADPKSEGFTEEKIVTEKAGRTFIGIDKNKDIIIGYTSATIDELSKACLALGLIDAMCLDGGWSTAVYADGRTIINGRDINNGIGFDFMK